MDMFSVDKESSVDFLPGEQNGYVMVQGVLVSFHVEFLLPLTEAVQAVVSVMCNL